MSSHGDGVESAGTPAASSSTSVNTTTDAPPAPSPQLAAPQPTTPTRPLSPGRESTKSKSDAVAIEFTNAIQLEPTTGGGATPAYKSSNSSTAPSPAPSSAASFGKVDRDDEDRLLPRSPYLMSTPNSPGPSSSAGSRGGGGFQFPPWAIIIAWISLSTSVILYNQRILVGAGFPYPITLTTLHLLFQTTATRILHRYTDLVAGPNSEYSAIPLDPDATDEDMAAIDKQRKANAVAMEFDPWLRQIVPPAALFSISLVASNWVYLFLSVSYIHVLKAFAPVAILLAAFAFGTKAFSMRLVFIVLVISFGTAIASYGEAAFSMTGFLLQIFAMFVEATRVTLIQILLGGKDMSPLKTLYYFAPICLGINAALILPVEGFAAIQALPKLGFFVIFCNCALTFLLNLSTVYLIGLSTIVLSLTKVVKDILLVCGSIVLLGESLSIIQVLGYTVATIGLFYYKASPP